MTKPLPIRFKECEECHKVFQIKNIRAKYCSRKCGGKAWSRDHRSYMVEAQRRTLQNPIHKQRKTAYMREYNQRPEVIARRNELARLNYLKDPEPIKAYVRAQRYRYKVGHTKEEWGALKAIYGSRCAYCGRKMRRLTKDHIVPISQGNPETVDKISNIIPACRHCNSTKHTGKPPAYQIILATKVIMPTRSIEELEEILG